MPQPPGGSLEPVWLAQRERVLAPDGSEIRELVRSAGASLSHCTLPAGVVSRAIRHKSVEEFWYVLSGNAEIWRKSGAQEELLEAGPGCSLRIPTDVAFQFRTTGNEPFIFLIATVPTWPDEEAEPVEGRWTGAAERP